MAALAIEDQPPALTPDHPCRRCNVRGRAMCRALDCQDLAKIRGAATTHHLQAGQPLFHEGDRTVQVYNLTRGSLKLYKLLPDGRRQVTGFVFPSDFLGITAETEHAFTAEALEDAQLCQFDRARFHDLIERVPSLERELYRIAAHELAAAHGQMLLLGRKTAPERMATFLADLLEKGKRADAPAALKGRINLPMSWSDIADHVGLTKETVSRVLALFRSNGLIRLTSINCVQVLDCPGLVKLAQGQTDV